MKDDRLYLHHMLERCHRITRFIGPGREAFMASGGLQDAVIRNVEVIGEAAKRISAEACSRLPLLDWKTICRRQPAPPAGGKLVLRLLRFFSADGSVHLGVRQGSEAPELIERQAKAFEKVWAHRSELAKL